MAKLEIKKGTTSKRIFIAIRDSSSTTGAYKTGLTNSSITASYNREDDGNAGATTISLSAGTRGTWSSGGFVEKDSANAKGDYELGIPNAALVTGSNVCTITIQDAASNNVAPLKVEIQLVDYDPQDAVHLGLSCLPNTAVTSNASLITSGSGTDQLTVSGGIASADAKKINAVSTSSVTTVSANQGTTQPVNFTGTGASALVQTDVTDIATVAVSTSTAQLGVNVVNWHGGAVPAPNVTGVPLVDDKYLLGTIYSTPATAGIMDVNVKNTVNVAATLDANNVINVSTKYVGGTLQTAADVGEVAADVDELITTIGVAGAGLTGITGVTLAAGQKVDVDTIKTNPVVNAGTVTFPTTATLASTTNITAGTITTTTNLTNAPTAGDFTSTMKTSLNAATPASVTGGIGGDVSGKVLGGGASTFSAVGVQADIEQIAGSSGGATRLDRAARAIVTGTVGTGSTTTSIVTSALSPPATTSAGQFKGLVLKFDKDTTTANLRGQGAVINGVTSGGVIDLTGSALTDAAVSGDTFTIQ